MVQVVRRIFSACKKSGGNGGGGLVAGVIVGIRPGGCRQRRRCNLGAHVVTKGVSVAPGDPVECVVTVGGKAPPGRRAVRSVWTLCSERSSDHAGIVHCQNAGFNRKFSDRQLCLQSLRH